VWAKSTSGTGSFTTVVDITTIDEAGKPVISNKLATSNNVSSTVWASTQKWINYTFPTEIVLSTNTTYALVIRLATTGTKKGEVSYKAGYADGVGWYSTNWGASWSIAGGASPVDYQFRIWGNDAVTNVTITSSTTGSGYCLVDGEEITTPDSYLWLVGSSHNITANQYRVIYENVERRAFASWSDAGARSHNITIPIAPSGITYTATYHSEFKHVVEADAIEGDGIITFNATDVSAPYVTDWIRSGDTFVIFGYLMPEGFGYVFESWDGDAANPREWTVAPTTSANYTATYVEGGGGGGVVDEDGATFWFIFALIILAVGFAFYMGGRD